jgi:hypothetical protein
MIELFKNIKHNADNSSSTWDDSRTKGQKHQKRKESRV